MPIGAATTTPAKNQFRSVVSGPAFGGGAACIGVPVGIRNPPRTLSSDSSRVWREYGAGGLRFHDPPAIRRPYGRHGRSGALPISLRKNCWGRAHIHAEGSENPPLRADRRRGAGHGDRSRRSPVSGRAVPGIRRSRRRAASLRKQPPRGGPTTPKQNHGLSAPPSPRPADGRRRGASTSFSSTPHPPIPMQDGIPPSTTPRRSSGSRNAFFRTMPARSCRRPCLRAALSAGLTSFRGQRRRRRRWRIRACLRRRAARF